MASPPSDLSGAPDWALNLYWIVTVVLGAAVWRLAPLLERLFPRRSPPDMQVLGAVVDNRAVEPLLAELRKLNRLLARHNELREGELEEEEEKEARRELEETIEEKIRRIMIESGPAAGPPARRP